MTTHPIDALDRWLIDKDGQGLIKPLPVVVYLTFRTSRAAYLGD